MGVVVAHHQFLSKQQPRSKEQSNSKN